MKNFFAFLWRATIPILWLLSVLAIVRGGFDPGFVPYQVLPEGQSYPSPLPVRESPPYPWAGVIVISIATAIECAVLYLILRPSKFAWSLKRVGVAFAVFLPLSIWLSRTINIDVAGDLFALGVFTLLLAFLLFILLIITAVVTVVKHFSKGMHAE
jgi:hypothetical protein